MLNWLFGRKSIPNIRACERCGKEFTPRTTTHRFCSTNCSAANTAKAFKNGAYVGCAVCGERVYLALSTYKLQKGRAYCAKHKRKKPSRVATIEMKYLDIT